MLQVLVYDWRCYIPSPTIILFCEIKTNGFMSGGPKGKSLGGESEISNVIESLPMTHFNHHDCLYSLAVYFILLEIIIRYHILHYSKLEYDKKLKSN